MTETLEHEETIKIGEEFTPTHSFKADCIKFNRGGVPSSIPFGKPIVFMAGLTYKISVEFGKTPSLTVEVKTGNVNH